MKFKLLLLVLGAFFTLHTQAQLPDTIKNDLTVNGVWQNNYLVVLSYNSQCQKTGNLVLGWNPLTKAWVNGTNTTITYNSNGSTYQYVQQTWNINNQWENAYQSTYSYGSDGISYTYTNRVWANFAWQDDSRYTGLYDAAGNFTSLVIERYLNNTWTNSYKLSFTYNQKNQNTSSVSSSYPNNAWFDYVKTIFTYSANNKQMVTKDYQRNDSVSPWQMTRQTKVDLRQGLLYPAKEVWQNWVAATNSWINFRQTTNTLTPNGSLKLQKVNGWNGLTWVANYRTRRDYYTGNGATHHENNDVFNPATNKWGGETRRTYTNNGCAQHPTLVKTNALSQLINKGYGNKQAAKDSAGKLLPGYNAPGNKIYINEKGQIQPVIWLPGTTANSDGYEIILTTGNAIPATAALKATTTKPVAISKTVISVVPNPATNYLTVSAKSTIQQIQLVNTAGQLLKTITPNATNCSIPVASLTAGTYFLRIKTLDGLETRKFLKE